MTKVCICGKKFKVEPARGARGENKYCFCSDRCSALWRLANNKKKHTSIEVALEVEFARRGVSFLPQHPIPGARTVPDIFIAPNIAVYADGDYWHRRPEVAERDIRQTIQLLKLGYKVYRFWEKDIHADVVNCVDSIKEII